MLPFSSVCFLVLLSLCFRFLVSGIHPLLVFVPVVYSLLVVLVVNVLTPLVLSLVVHPLVVLVVDVLSSLVLSLVVHPLVILVSAPCIQDLNLEPVLCTFFGFAMM